MHLCARRLANDEDSRRRIDLHDRARPERQMLVAGAAGAHAVSMPSSVRWILTGEALTNWIGCDFTTGEHEGRQRYCMSTAETLRMSMALLATARGRMDSEN